MSQNTDTANWPRHQPWRFPCLLHARGHVTTLWHAVALQADLDLRCIDDHALPQQPTTSTNTAICQFTWTDLQLATPGSWMYCQLSTEQELSSCWDGNRARAKWAEKWRGCCAPFHGGSWSPSNAMWLGPRPTYIPSGIVIHPTVWPQYTNVTDRTDRQRSDSIGWTVLQMVAQKTKPNTAKSDVYQ